jgi:hypothetical protein
VTDKVEKAVADALAREADRLCTTAKKLDEIAGKMQGRSRRDSPMCNCTSKVRAMRAP